MPVFPTPGPIVVRLQAGWANVRVVATDRADTVVEVASTGESPREAKAAEQTTVEFSQGELLIQTPKTGWRQYTPFTGTKPVDITIELPTGSSVFGGSSYGTFETAGVLGPVTFSTSAGDIHLEQVADVTLKNGSGEISVDRIDGSAEVTNSNGAIRVGRIAGSAAIRNSHGLTMLDDVTGDLTFKGAYGDLFAREVEGSVGAKTAHGAIHIGEVVRGSIQVETSYGKVDVGIREGTPAWLDVKSEHGRVRSLLTADEGPSEAEQTDQTVEVRARTGWGDITIRPAG